jgi:hypothetical protein
MPETFYLTGIIEPTKHGRSFKIYELVDGQRIFIGLISRQALADVLCGKNPVGDICKFSQNAVAEQESISAFSVVLTPKGANTP